MDEFEREKVFCIGLNKTGTTSLERALKDLGYALGDQHRGEMLLHHYANRQFGPIVEFARSADAFQDAPFSYPFTYVALDQAFPNAKFVLSVRDDAEQWYQSLVEFHSQVFGRGERPTKKDLQSSRYCYPGFAWEAHRCIFDTPEDDIYDRQTLIDFYDDHNRCVRSYFRKKPNFIEINLSHSVSYSRLCSFLGKEPTSGEFPWLNRRRAGSLTGDA